MQKIIENLLYIIEVQKQTIIISLFLSLWWDYKPPKPDKIADKKYMKLSVDPLPVFEKVAPRKIYDCNELIAQNNIKPVSSLSLILIFRVLIALLMGIFLLLFPSLWMHQICLLNGFRSLK